MSSNSKDIRRKIIKIKAEIGGFLKRKSVELINLIIDSLKRKYIK